MLRSQPLNERGMSSIDHFFATVMSVSCDFLRLRFAGPALRAVPWISFQ